MRRGFPLALLALLVVLPASGHAASARPGVVCQAGDTMITIADFSFTPSEVTVPVGTTVCWTNNGPSTHTATSDDLSTFNSGPLATGESFEFTFTVDNVAYGYHCTFHPQMMGTITVGTPPPP